MLLGEAGSSLVACFMFSRFQDDVVQRFLKEELAYSCSLGGFDLPGSEGLQVLRRRRRIARRIKGSSQGFEARVCFDRNVFIT